MEAWRIGSDGPGNAAASQADGAAGHRLERLKPLIRALSRSADVPLSLRLRGAVTTPR